MTLDSEERHPKDEGDEDGKAWIDQRPRPHIGIDRGADEEQPDEQRRDDSDQAAQHPRREKRAEDVDLGPHPASLLPRSEEHTSELQSLAYLVCRLLLEKKK